MSEVLMGHKAGIGVEKHYYRPDSITGVNSLLELYAKKAMPYLTISEESRLKLKNLELEIRRKKERERFNLALKTHQRDNKSTTGCSRRKVSESNGNIEAQRLRD